MNFKQLNIKLKLLRKIDEFGFKDLTSIQEYLPDRNLY